VKAGVRKLSLGFKTGNGQQSVAAVACLFDGGIKQGCLPDAWLAGEQQRAAVLRRFRQGFLQLSSLSLAPDQPPDHAVKIRELAT
jgi:hypothetical protein